MPNYEKLIIDVQNLTKRFGDFLALDSLNLSIEKGKIYGLIGPNGSGKTTAIQCILGLYDFEPSSQIRILNYKIPQESRKSYQHIGYMPQDISLYNDLSVEQNLRFFGRVKNIPRTRLESRIQELLKLVDLQEFKSREISKCSGGMQRRASLACALLSEPEILILDEPTVGIDPELREHFWDYFRMQARDKGVSILITTHYLDESHRCDEISLIKKSVIIKGRPDELKEITKKELNLSENPDMDQVFIHFTKKTAMEVDI
jgi:ABC-2 type transport system ATP-binding protein